MRLLMRAGTWLVIGGLVALAGWGLGRYEAHAKAAKAVDSAPVRAGVATKAS